ncbi:L-allo-threonine aldolase [hydrothermal vent metagenome]|uniref:L-allo-threonine aldolase n=1 Tax=hydrothermal vent metagenome TaxID=652676 RepID=A0A3B0QQD2_9ZZZZ
MEINLISDTITRPTSGMLQAMMNAKVGDDVFNADPTVIELQDKLANIFGKEAALYFPSGTMANQAAIKIHTQPAEQMICDKWAHVFNFEGGGAAFNSGVSCSLIDGDRGMFTAKQVKLAINDPENYHTPITSLVAVENTTNKGGGACWNFSELQKIRKVCDDNNLAYHLDGARLYNALVAKNETPKQYGNLFDTISICLSKGMGAPIGSVLLGSKADIKKAIRIRKLYGGAMRQVGYLAAAGIYALDHHVERLAEDHRRAKNIGEALNNCEYIDKVEPIETNILIFYVKGAYNETSFVKALKAKNILISSMGEGKLRMVTHLDFTEAMLETVIHEINTLKI